MNTFIFVDVSPNTDGYSFFHHSLFDKNVLKLIDVCLLSPEYALRTNRIELFKRLIRNNPEEKKNPVYAQIALESRNLELFRQMIRSNFAYNVEDATVELVKMGNPKYKKTRMLQWLDKHADGYIMSRRVFHASFVPDNVKFTQGVYNNINVHLGEADIVECVKLGGYNTLLWLIEDERVRFGEWAMYEACRSQRFYFPTVKYLYDNYPGEKNDLLSVRVRYTMLRDINNMHWLLQLFPEAQIPSMVLLMKHKGMLRTIQFLNDHYDIPHISIMEGMANFAQFIAQLPYNPERQFVTNTPLGDWLIANGYKDLFVWFENQLFRLWHKFRLWGANPSDRMKGHYCSHKLYDADGTMRWCHDDLRRLNKYEKSRRARCNNFKKEFDLV